MSAHPIEHIPPAISLAQAHELVCDPRAIADHDGMRLMVWAVLKSARGQTVKQQQLRRMQRYTSAAAGLIGAI